jgi:AcrR family transcriptional regulator
MSQDRRMPTFPSPAPLSEQRILTAAEDMVRRHGAGKATVVDVAQALGVSHGSIYRFFPTKVALREAVVGVWLGRTIAAQGSLVLEGPVIGRLKTWFFAFFDLKRSQLRSDPELFEAFRLLSAEARSSVEAYKEALVAQLAELVATGIAAGELVPGDPVVVARALLGAMTKFHHPALAAGWESPQVLADLEPLWAVLARGISLERKSS